MGWKGAAVLKRHSFRVQSVKVYLKCHLRLSVLLARCGTGLMWKGLISRWCIPRCRRFAWSRVSWSARMAATTSAIRSGRATAPSATASSFRGRDELVCTFKSFLIFLNALSYTKNKTNETNATYCTTCMKKVSCKVMFICNYVVGKYICPAVHISATCQYLIQHLAHNF